MGRDGDGNENDFTTITLPMLSMAFLAETMPTFRFAMARQRVVFRWDDMVHAAKHDRLFDYAYWMELFILTVVDASAKYFSAALILLGFLLVFALGLSGTRLVLPLVTPYYAESDSNYSGSGAGTDVGSVSYAFITHVLFAAFILTNIVFNYLMAVATDPGSPSPRLSTGNNNGDSSNSSSSGSRGSEDDADSSLSQDPTHSRDPGEIEPSLLDLGHEAGVDAAELRGEILERMGFCGRCEVAKPPRSHHCRVCNRCILKMDHHCPWIGGCAGLRNYRYFVTFLFWAAFGTFYLAFMTFYVLHQRVDVLALMWNFVARSPFGDFLENTFGYVLGLMENGGEIADEGRTRMFEPGVIWWVALYSGYQTMSTNSALLACLVGAASVFLPVGGLCIFHFRILLTGQTTVEYAGNTVDKAKCEAANRPFFNPFDRGMRANFQQVFGPCSIWRAFLPSCRAAPPVLPPLTEGSGLGHDCVDGHKSD